MSQTYFPYSACAEESGRGKARENTSGHFRVPVVCVECLPCVQIEHHVRLKYTCDTSYIAWHAASCLGCSQSLPSTSKHPILSNRINWSVRTQSVATSGSLLEGYRFMHIAEEGQG